MGKRVLSMLLTLYMVVGLLPALSVEAEAAHENTHKNTGNYAVDIVEVAKTQIGYGEENGITKYGSWAGNARGAWCGFFVSWCANQANIPDDIVISSSTNPNRGNGALMHAWYSNKGCYYELNDITFSTIATGDIVLINNGTIYGHIGLVEYVDYTSKIVHTIEGNLGLQRNTSEEVDYYSVRRCERTSGGKVNNITGFIHPDYGSRHEHTYVNGVCSVEGCGEWDQRSLTGAVSCKGHVVVQSSGAVKRVGPYDKCDKKAVAGGEKLPVTGWVTNAVGNKWYVLSDGYYIYEKRVTYSPTELETSLRLNCQLRASGMEEGSSNALMGSYGSCYPLSFEVKVDGKIKYAVSSPGTSYQIAAGDGVNNAINFPSLTAGNHIIEVNVSDTSGAKRTYGPVTLTVRESVPKPSCRVNSISGGKCVYLDPPAGGTIHYTTDGSEPTVNSPIYDPSVGIRLLYNAAYTVIKAITVLDGKASAVTKQEVVVPVAQTPSFHVDYTAEGSRVTISGDSRSTIWYTIDGVTKQYIGPFTLTSAKTVSAYAEQSGCSNSETVSESVTVSAPAAPQISAPMSGTKLAQGHTATVQWAVISNAGSYTVKAYKDGVLFDTRTMSANSAAFPLEDAARYSFTVSARNAIGESGESSPVEIVSMPPCTVIYADYDGTELYRQIVDYGGSADAPSISPEREGYDFLGWGKTASNVTEDITINARYKIKTFTVTFTDYGGRKIGAAQRIDFGSPANPPSPDSFTAPSDAYSFVGWSISAASLNSRCDLSFIDSDMTVQAVFSWTQPELPVVIREMTAHRDDDQATGRYTISVTLENSNEQFTRGVLRVSLKTTDTSGATKLVDTASQTVALTAGSQNNQYTFSMIYKGVAATAEAVVVGYDYEGKSGPAFSAAKTVAVETVSEYRYGDYQLSEWTESDPRETETNWVYSDGNYYLNGVQIEVEEKTQYRYSDRQTVRSSSPNYPGYTYTGKQITSWTNWSDWSRTPVYASETRHVKTRDIPPVTQTQYHYERWRSDGFYGSDGRWIYQIGYHEGYFSGRYCYHYEEVTSSTKLSSSGFYDDRYGYMYNSGLYFNETPITVEVTPGYTEYQYQDAIYTYYFERWTDMSEWQDAYVAATDDRRVETRTVYNYKLKNKEVLEATSHDGEDASGTLWTFSNAENNANTEHFFSVPNALPDASVLDLSGKAATILVYKGKNTDPNESQVEYAGQFIIGTDNAFSVSFKTREEPNADTGDFIVALSVQGSGGLINIGLIPYERPSYRVEYTDDEGMVISTQTVREGSNAAAPAAPTKESYIFTHWSEPGTNIQSDTTITAHYVPKTYAVTFIDWVNGTASAFALEYGRDLAVLASELQPAAPGHRFLYWDRIEDGETSVSGNMVISAVYEAEQYTVNFYDSYGEGKSLVASRTVGYGETAELPEPPAYENRVFLGWDTLTSWWDVTADVDVYPITAYLETAAEPLSNLGSFAYGMNETLVLTADDGALIYYTTDGNDPIPGLNGQEYTSPITLNEDTVIRAVSVESGKNNSDVISVSFIYSEGHDYAPDSSDLIHVGTYTPIVSPGDSVTLQVEMEDNPGILSYLFYIECDRAAFYLNYDEETGYACLPGDASQGGSFLVAPYEDGWKVMWFGAEVLESSGNLFSITLSVNEEAMEGEYPITVAYSRSNTLDAFFESADLEVGGNINANMLLGDVNGDGYITTADVIRIARGVLDPNYLSESQKLAADVTDDGKITNADVIRLARYILGLVELR